MERANAGSRAPQTLFPGIGRCFCVFDVHGAHKGCGARRGAPTAPLPRARRRSASGHASSHSRKRRCLGTRNAAAAAGKGTLSHSRAEESRRASSSVPCLLQHPGTPARIPVGTSGLLTEPALASRSRVPAQLAGFPEPWPLQPGLGT